MPATLTTDLTLIDSADAVLNWATVEQTDFLQLEDSNFKQGTAAVGGGITSLGLNGVVRRSISPALNLSNTHIFIWATLTGMRVDTRVNGGFRIRVESGAAATFGEWYVGGQDTYTGGFQMFVADTTRAFDRQSVTPPTMTAITGVGIVINGTSVPGGDVRGLAVDVMRFGSGIAVTGGTVAVPLRFQDIDDADRTGASPPQYGIFQRHASEDVFVLTGRLTIGDTAGTLLTVFKDTNQVVSVADLPVAQGHPKLEVGSNVTNPTQFSLGNEIGTPPNSLGSGGGLAKSQSTTLARRLRVLSADPDVSKADLLGATILGYEDITWDQPENRIISCLLSGGQTITLRGSAILRDSTITNSTAPVTSAAVDLGDADPAINTFRDMQIQSCPRGILLRKTVAGDVTYNFRNIEFAGNTFDVRVDFPVASTVTINVLEGGTTPTVENVNGSTVNVVANIVSATVKTVTTAGANLASARVLVTAASGGPFPFDAAVTITRVTTTATVAHTAHGLATNDKVLINGANEIEYNGVFTITKIDNNSYSYTVSGTPATPATGTIKATFAVLSGLTDVNGEITMSRVFPSAQPITGRARKSSAPAPFFRTGDIVGTVSASAGFSATVQMITDE